MGMTIEEAREFLINISYKLGSMSVEYLSEKDGEKMREAISVLEQEHCEDAISRKSIKQKLQEHHDFFVNAYGGFSNLPQNDKSRVDEITNCIAMVVNEPPVTPQEPQTFKWCTSCKEYDQEHHCCHRWSKVIRNTVEEIKLEYIEREVLDKIRAEIVELTKCPYGTECLGANCPSNIDCMICGDHVLNILDKYKAENNS